MPYIKANGVRIAFETYGDMSNPPLFIVHGLYGDRYGFETLAEQFSNYFFVISMIAADMDSRISLPISHLWITEEIF